ncbi:MAG: YihY/virulence factor BrkB family protein [Acidobacteria bacterium]|nr:YihY/virulence factor BrkB family protein [Acidobacteriota bacterium]
MFAVIRKFGDDRGSTLAALFAYYAFVSLFPLLLLLVTLLGYLLAHHPALQERVLHSALLDFPIIGDQIAKNIHSLRARGIGVVLGLAGLVWGSLGLAQQGQYAMAQVWNVPGVVRPNFVVRMARSLGLLLILGCGVTASSALGGVAGATGVLTALASLAGSVTLNVVVFVLAFRVLTPAPVPTRELRPGAVVAAIGWSALQYGGGYLVGHQLRHASEVYGFFGTVLGLLSFLALAGTITLYAAELNVVRARRLWPRSIVQPPLTRGDRQVLTDIARQEERRPEQRVIVEYPPEPVDPSPAG